MAPDLSTLFVEKFFTFFSRVTLKLMLEVVPIMEGRATSDAKKLWGQTEEQLKP
jgi:hypothetical protein